MLTVNDEVLAGWQEQEGSQARDSHRQREAGCVLWHVLYPAVRNQANAQSEHRDERNHVEVEQNAASRQVEGNFETQGACNQEAQVPLLILPPEVQADHHRRCASAQQEAILGQPRRIEEATVREEGSLVAV